MGALIHGMTETREYRIWRGMKQRCCNHNNADWHRYGGRGIRICVRWLNSFEAFFADMGAAPSVHHSIDRIDNDGNYEPGNCRWATYEVQNGNQSRCRKNIVRLGHCVQPSTAWDRDRGFYVGLIRSRIKRGWTAERAISKVPKPFAKKFVTFQGRTKYIAEWSKESGVCRKLINTRLKLGWPVEKAIFTPPKKYTLRPPQPA